MAKQKIETSIEINGIDVVAYPFVESDHVTFENGMSINEMIKEDVVTPIVTHEETSFKVGKGDSDVSSSIVDSSVGEMTIKGQTYQNILPEPSLRNSMNNGKTMQKFNEGYDSVNVIDGVGKSAILKGQTLVNLQQKGSHWNINGSTNNPNSNASYRSNEGFPLNKIKPNTKYLVKFSKDISAAYGSFYFVQGTQAEWLIQPGGWGIVTTKSELTSSITSIHVYPRASNGATAESLQDVHPMIIEYQEGMENWDIPYFEGMQSVQMPVLTVSNYKNLANETSIDYGFINNDTILVQKKWLVSDFISVEADVSYSARSQGVTNDVVFVIVFYDQNESFISRKVSKVAVSPTNAKYARINVRKSDSSSITDEEKNNTVLYFEKTNEVLQFDSQKSHTLTTPSDLTLRGIGDVYDTLDLVSGEVTQRVAEVVLNGSENWKLQTQDDTFVEFALKLPNLQTKWYKGLCDNFTWDTNATKDKEKIYINGYGKNLGLLIRKDRLASVAVDAFKTFLKNNNVKYVVELDDSVIKTVDLSSSGNWEKVVLDGSEDEGWRTYSSPYQNSTSLFGIAKNTNIFTNPLLPTNNNTMPSLFSNHYGIETGNGIWNNEKVSVNINAVGDFFVRVSKLNGQDVGSFKQYLQANPITVWYQTTTHKDSTQVKQLLSFSNGHIQLSSEKGSLIPSLDYEVPTSNSYHLDLAKTSTQYTMKNMSETFTIDGTQYNASANSAFTTPTSMANKLMITSVVQSNVMLLEGDLTSKTIPYFKGIKSAFEGEDEIEILSVGKNLFDVNGGIIGDRTTLIQNNAISTKPKDSNVVFTIDNKNSMTFSYSIAKRENVVYVGAVLFKVLHDDGTETNIHEKAGITTITFSKPVKSIKLVNWCNGEFIIENIQLEQGTQATPYQPYKSNITKIPLSSPLRSLPNGVRDEVILDRENNKVKVIQRVGHEMFDGSEGWKLSPTFSHYGYNQFNLARHKITSDINDSGMNSRFIRIPSVWSSNIEGFSYQQSAGNGRAYAWIKRKQLNFPQVSQLKADLHANPLVTTYPLETPIITEIDLDGYPYIYKDGHIFLNSEIAPTTTMKYSINQSHQIESQNGDLIRHEKEINYLYTLIAKYVNVQYESTLLNLDLELSRA